MKITPEILIRYNKLVEESGIVISRQNLESVFSAYEYYDSNVDKVSSILRGIVKNHAFVDGNKRVGAMFLLRALNDRYNFDDDEISNLILDIAENNFKVEQISEKIQKLTNFSGLEKIE